VAFLPSVALLGFALPVTFLATIDQFLHYMTWRELVPTLGTAWIFLAAICLPTSLIVAMVLKKLDCRPEALSAGYFLSVVLIAIAASVLVGALLSGFIIWLRTFGLLSRVHIVGILGWGSLGLGLFIGALPAGRTLVSKFYDPCTLATVMGGFAILSLPFTGWVGDARLSAHDGLRAREIRVARPNILLVTIDTLSAEHMSLYGSQRATTPRLDAFSQRAVVFDRAYSNGNFTTPGIASILTATRPWTHRAVQLEGWPLESTRRNSLPALLRTVGYQTAYVGTSPWAGANRIGFGSYFNFAATDAVTNVTFCRDRIAAFLPYVCAATELAPFIFIAKLTEKIREFAFDRPANWQFDPKLAATPALDWLATADKHTPIFLWVHFLPPHSPYAAPAPWLGTFDSSLEARSFADSDSVTGFLFKSVPQERAQILEARYDESISYVDHFVGEFLDDAMHSLGDNTVVVVIADHGESFEHGYGMHTGTALYDSIVRIPLIIKLPHQSEALRTSAIAEQIDVAPTIAEIAGLAPDATWEGHSLLISCCGPSAVATNESKPAFSMNFEENAKESTLTTGSVAIIDGRWKLIRYMGNLHYPRMPRLVDELYDLSGDPKESVNRALDQPAEAKRLGKLIADQLSIRGVALR
jgi:arylsulfatase A-like enzyme